MRQQFNFGVFIDLISCVYHIDSLQLIINVIFYFDLDVYKASYSQTTRGKDQLLFCGQPFIYEKCIRLQSGESKKLWRCNQWCVPMNWFPFIGFILIFIWIPL